MKKLLILIGAALAVVLAGSLCLITRRAPVPPVHPRASDAVPSTALAPANSTARSSSPSPAGLETGSIDSPPKAAPTPGQPVAFAAHAATIRSALGELRQLHGPAGSLNWDDAKALIARRQQATEVLVGRLADLGPGGARAIALSYPEADSVRGKLLLVQALGRINDPEASALLSTLFGQENSLSVRQEMIRAVGKRSDAQAETVLLGLLTGAGDVEQRFVAAQALASRPNAVPALVAALRAEANQEVRKELAHTLGQIGNTAAREALMGVVRGGGDLALRQTAVQELGRGFGAGAPASLEGLLNDPNAAIRTTAIKSMARLTSRSQLPTATGGSGTAPRPGP